MGAVVEFVELAGCEIFRRVPMGGRFGKYGDAKRKAQISTLNTEYGRDCFRMGFAES